MIQLPAIPTLSNLSRRERLLAMSGVLVVSLVVLDRLVLTPWWRYTRHIHQEIQKLNQEIAARQRLLGRKQEIQRRVDAFRSVLHVAKTSEVDLAELVREIETLGTQSGVVLGPINPLPATASEGSYEEHSLEVQYQGTLEQAVRFLYLVESSKALFQIDRATLVLQKEKKESDELKGSLRLTSTLVKEAPKPVSVTGAK